MENDRRNQHGFWPNRAKTSQSCNIEEYIDWIERGCYATALKQIVLIGALYGPVEAFRLISEISEHIRMEAAAIRENFPHGPKELHDALRDLELTFTSDVKQH